MPKLAQIIKKFTDDTVLYWERNGDDGFSKPKYLTAVPVKVRWEDKEQEIIMPDGRVVKSGGYLLLSTPMKAGSWIWRGTQAQWEAQPFFPKMPTILQGGREVLKDNRTPGIKQLPGEVHEVYF